MDLRSFIYLFIRSKCTVLRRMQLCDCARVSTLIYMHSSISPQRYEQGRAGTVAKQFGMENGGVVQM